MPAAPRLQVLIPRAEIRRRVRAMARGINRDFRGRPVRLVGVLNGACVFLADLARELDLETSIDFIAVASYGSGKKSSGRIKLVKNLDSSIKGLNVILVEDIIDTGRTAAYLRRVLAAGRPKCLCVAALLDKPSRRLRPDVQPDYFGFQIPDRFVVGYGLDWAGRFRHLRDICVLLPPAGSGRRRLARAGRSG